MKRILVFSCLGGLALQLFSFIPIFFGARSLALGQATLAFNADGNALFLNPALMARFSYSSTGLQYQQQFFDYKDFSSSLSTLLADDLQNFESLAAADKTKIWGDLSNLFHSKVGISGSIMKNSAFASRDYGFAISLVDEGAVSPYDSSLFATPANQVKNTDIAGLKMNFLGLHYTDYSFAYALPILDWLNIGATLHYMTGKVSDFDLNLFSAPFSRDSGSSDYLKKAWGERQKSFSKVTLDLSASASFGGSFYVGLMAKNMVAGEIQTPLRTIPLEKRYIAGLAFQSQDYWGIFLDMDLLKSDLFFNGHKSQPISLGVEKGFSRNSFSLRAGFLNDLTEETFFGGKSNILYGLGMGFNVNPFQIDLALAIDPLGKIKSLAISAFFILKDKN